MSNNLISLTVTDAQLQAVDQALTQIETQLSGLVGLSAMQRQAMAKMGDKSEAFCRQTLRLMVQNPHVVPSTVPVDVAQANLAVRDALRPRWQRLRQLSERAADTDMLLGNSVMTISLQGYSVLKISGRNQGLDGLSKSLGSRFARPSQKSESAAAPVEGAAL